MRNAQRWPLVLGLIVLGHSRAAASPDGHRLDALAGITIHVSNYAGVDPKELTEAERMATSIFRDAGVTVRWADAPQVSAREDREAHGLSEIQVHIQSSNDGRLARSFRRSYGIQLGCCIDRLSRQRLSVTIRKGRYGGYLILVREFWFTQ